MPSPSEIFTRQPFKLTYYLYAIAMLLVKVPYWSTMYYFVPSKRLRPSWTWRRSVFLRVLRSITEALAKTGDAIYLRVDPRKFEGSSDGQCCLVWAEPTPELVVGPIQEFAIQNEVAPAPVPGYWYGGNAPAAPGEKIIYEIHGAIAELFLPLDADSLWV